jgi:hypothetical protein
MVSELKAVGFSLVLAAPVSSYQPDFELLVLEHFGFTKLV